MGDCKSVSIYSRWFESNLSHLIIDYYPNQTVASNYLKKSTCLTLIDGKTILKSKKTVFKTCLDRKSNIVSYVTLGTTTQTTNFVLNFKRLRFFPLTRPRYSGETVFTTSLGCIAKFLNKGKSYTKNKAVFLLTGILLRRILLYSGFIDMHL